LRFYPGVEEPFHLSDVGSVAALSREPKGPRGRFSEAFGGSVNRREKVRLRFFYPDTLPVVQAQRQPAALVGYAARAVHIHDAGADALHARAEAPLSELQPALEVRSKRAVPFDISTA
jgi:hypothetical protein